MKYREVRLPCDTEVTVLAGETMTRATFVNVSPGGARLRGMDPLPRDSLVTLQMRGHRQTARVAWSEGGEIGLRFPIKLSTAEIGTFRGTGAAQAGGPWVPVQRLRELS